ncbi:hypothetical protein Tco_0215762 [Tanacetum coccineum]
MNTTKEQQKALDDALVAPENRLKIGKCNQRLSPTLKYNEPTIQVALDALKITPFYNTFEVSADVPEIYMQEDLGHTGEIKVLSDVNVNHLHQPWRSFAAIIKNVDYVEKLLLWKVFACNTKEKQDVLALCQGWPHVYHKLVTTGKN